MHTYSLLVTTFVYFCPGQLVNCDNSWLLVCPNFFLSFLCWYFKYVYVLLFKAWIFLAIKGSLVTRSLSRPSFKTPIPSSAFQLLKYHTSWFFSVCVCCFCSLIWDQSLKVIVHLRSRRNFRLIQAQYENKYFLLIKFTQINIMGMFGFCYFFGSNRVLCYIFWFYCCLIVFQSFISFSILSAWVYICISSTHLQGLNFLQVVSMSIFLSISSPTPLFLNPFWPLSESKLLYL